jgi:hypothetical protein
VKSNIFTKNDRWFLFRSRRKFGLSGWYTSISNTTWTRFASFKKKTTQYHKYGGQHKYGQYNSSDQGRIQDFKLEGGALKKIAPSGGRRENCWGISCEKSRFYAKKYNFFQF